MLNARYKDSKPHYIKQQSPPETGEIVVYNPMVLSLLLMLLYAHE